MTRFDQLALGTVVVDRVRRVPAFSQPGQKMVTPAPEPAPGGVALNHLAWSAALGLKTGLLGRLAEDGGGRYLRAAMDRHAISREGVVTVAEPTGVSEILAGPGGERAIYSFPGPVATLTPAQVRLHWAGMLKETRLLSSEISMMPLAAVLEAFRLAGRALNALDFDVPPAQATAPGGVGTPAQIHEAIRRTDILKATREAAEAWLGTLGLEDSALGLARAAGRRRIAAVTDGPRGAAVSDGRRAWTIPAFPAARPVDATGAGDSFFGGFIAGLLRGLPPAAAGRLGAACGAVCVETVGAFPPPDVWKRVMARYRGRRGGLGPPSVLRSGAASPGGRTLAAAAEALGRTAATADLPALGRAARLLAGRVRAGGRLHLAGVGKAGFVAARAAATLSSWGIPAYVLDCGGAAHGDLGRLDPRDAVVAVSKSGETRELLALVRMLKARRLPVIAVTGAKASPLAKAAGMVLTHPEMEEGGPWGLAPMASLLAESALLDALAAELAALLQRRPEHFAANHPGGTLGRRAARMARRR